MDGTANHGASTEMQWHTRQPLLSKYQKQSSLPNSIARVQWVAYVSTAWYCSSLYSCYNGRQDTIVKFFNIIYFCVVKSVTLTVRTVHFGPTTYWFTATISGGSLTRGTWLLGTENCTKIIFSVCVYCKLLLVCNYIKKYHIYVVVHQFKDVPATPTEPQCLKMFFTSILMQFVPLTPPPYLNTLISNTQSVILHSQKMFLHYYNIWCKVSE